MNYQTLLGKILNRTKQDSEHMHTYYYQKMALMAKMKFDNDVMVDLLIGGLTDKTVQAAAMAGNHQRSQDLLQFLMTVDGQLKSQPTRMRKEKMAMPYKRRVESGA